MEEQCPLVANVTHCYSMEARCSLQTLNQSILFTCVPDHDYISPISPIRHFMDDHNKMVSVLCAKPVCSFLTGRMFVCSRGLQRANVTYQESFNTITPKG